MRRIYSCAQRIGIRRRPIDCPSEMDATDLAFAGISRQADLIASGQVSSRELVELYLERIARLDPQLNAFRVVLGERALLEADQADARLRAGGERPLLGVPIAVKDDIDVAGEVTGFGTSAYGEPALKDAEIVRRARLAGAVVIGKTNVPELCAVPWTESPTRGATCNPWALERTPGGSSGGTAAAVAAGLVGAGLGSDAGGSIRCPAAYCGLFGLKTQRGRVPLAPSVDAWLGLSVDGVLTRSVADSALFHDAIADGPADPGAPAPRALRIALASRLPPSPLSRLHEDNLAALAETVVLLRRLGHEVNERELDYGPLMPPPEFTVRFLRSRHEDAVALAHPERLERRMRTIARLGGLIGPGIVAWARGREASYAARLNQPLADHDVLLTPVTPVPPPGIGACEGRGWLATTLVAGGTVSYLLSWNLTGQPACSVPAGFAPDGLPRAVQLVGRPNDEATLVALAAQLEAERPWAESRPAGFS